MKMNEQLVLFENEEVKVRTDEGNVLINLVHTAKCCGLVRTRNNNQLIRWDDVKKKLKSISSSIESSTPQYIEETRYILDEIENADDRTQIFMSSWLSKRMAMECSSEKAMAYKNFLATLDEKRENGELQISNQQVAQLISTTVQGIVPIMVTEITKQFAPMLGDSKKQVDTMVGLMHDQAVIYEEERNELKKLIGFRSVNTTKIINGIKDKLSDKYGYRINANSSIYQKIKKIIFKEFDVIKWEDIPVGDYHKVFAFADEYISDVKAM
jgi:hypothetical protein